MFLSRSGLPALTLVLILSGCNSALVGNLLVLGVTVAIFFGTLGLGRGTGSASRSAGRSADRSAADSSQS
jgi:hypothetical protein